MSRIAPRRHLRAGHRAGRVSARPGSGVPDGHSTIRRWAGRMFTFMHTPPPRDFDDGVLLGALMDSWGLSADDVRYVPKGAGSYRWAATAGGGPAAFLTVDDLDSKPWIAGHRDAAFDGLAAAYGAAWALEHGGISFAVGPLRTRREAVVLRLAARYSQALFPFVEGTPGTCDPLGTAGRDALIRQLAELHRTLPPPGLGLSRRPYAIPERAALMAALDQLGSRWEAGPLAEPARQALAARAADVTSWLGELEALAGLLRQDDADLVVTHGEPHPGNLIHTDAGARADRLGHRRARPSRARPVDARRRHPGMPSPAPGTGRAHDLRAGRWSFAWPGLSVISPRSCRCSGRLIGRPAGSAQAHRASASPRGRAISALQPPVMAIAGTRTASSRLLRAGRRICTSSIAAAHCDWPRAGWHDQSDLQAGRLGPRGTVVRPGMRIDARTRDRSRSATSPARAGRRLADADSTRPSAALASARSAVTTSTLLPRRRY